MRRVGHRPDRHVAVLVALCDALMLPEVFLPGGDDELLENPARLGAVLPRPPGTRDTAIWHFRGGKVAEIFTLQDQFGMLKQIGYLPESVHAA
jgi:hypothetical protein